MQAVFTEVATALNAVAAYEDDSPAQLPSPPPAPQRFAAAVQASLASDAQPAQGCASEVYPGCMLAQIALQLCSLTKMAYSLDVLTFSCCL